MRYLHSFWSYAINWNNKRRLKKLLLLAWKLMLRQQQGQNFDGIKVLVPATMLASLDMSSKRMKKLLPAVMYLPNQEELPMCKPLSQQEQQEQQEFLASMKKLGPVVKMRKDFQPVRIGEPTGASLPSGLLPGEWKPLLVDWELMPSKLQYQILKLGASRQEALAMRRMERKYWFLTPMEVPLPPNVVQEIDQRFLQRIQQLLASWESDQKQGAKPPSVSS